MIPPEAFLILAGKEEEDVTVGQVNCVAVAFRSEKYRLFVLKTFCGVLIDPGSPKEETKFLKITFQFAFRLASQFPTQTGITCVGPVYKPIGPPA